MDIKTVAGLGIVASLILLIFRKDRPELALGIALVAGVTIFLAVIPHLREVVGTLETLSWEAGLDPFYLGRGMKVLGISYISDFGAALCKDAGEEMLGQRVEFAGKIMILAASLPVLKSVLSLVVSLLG